MDAYEISKKIFNNNFNDNLTIQLDFNDDIKTFFEMCVLVTTEGLKKFYSDSDGKVNIDNLKISHIENINNYLKKINIKMELKKFTIIEWVNEKMDTIYKSYKEININKNTLLKELYFIIIKDYIYIINFDHIIV